MIVENSGEVGSGTGGNLMPLPPIHSHFQAAMLGQISQRTPCSCSGGRSHFSCPRLRSVVLPTQHL